MAEALNKDAVVSQTRSWVETHVIGLNLCPFAREAHAANRIRYVATEADRIETLRMALIDEILLLQTLDPAQTETTLLIHPLVLGDFLEYNDFLDLADETIEA